MIKNEKLIMYAIIRAFNRIKFLRKSLFLKYNILNEYKFDKSTLDPKKRKSGISGFMHLRNEQDFLAEVIESHLPYLDELIIVYNRCTDKTPEIAEGYRKRYPDKIKVYKYGPYVYHQSSKEHVKLPSCSPNSIVNYYNYALSKTTYRVALKVDGDQIAIPHVFREITDNIRRKGLKNCLFIKGINLWDDNKKIYVNGAFPICGLGDRAFFPVSKKTYFVYNYRYAIFKPNLKKKKEWAGIAFFHLKGMKKDRGISNYDLERNPHSRYHEHVKKYYSNPHLISWEEFQKNEPLAKDLPSPESLGIKPIR